MVVLNNMINENNRISNIELLKVFAIFLIIFSHVIPFNYNNFSLEYIDIRNASFDYNNIALQFIRYFGQIGNVIFLICSSWFLCEKREIRFKKIVFIVIDCFIISVICLFIIKLAGQDIDKITLIKQFHPLRFYNNLFVSPQI